ncbi:TonB-dependent receptor [Botryobacter ruber]|uniref:TonB-dependent receptor n=1 Tax=Botryobacter ruber TaxID=2171629 RepID=UPI000E0A12D4|nr:TonB-dependent receptor [Botryobacter ruber]
MLRVPFLFFLLLFSVALQAQPGQTIRGTVREQLTGAPLPDATVSIAVQPQPYITTTNESGHFVARDIPAGRHTIRISHLGYQDLVLQVLHISGKETVLDVRLEEAARQLPEVAVSTGERAGLDELNSRSFTIEQTQRYAATFYDPARLAASFPGVVTANDQANHISVRGNSPNHLLWRLEGVDIVNPNHLTNAGTVSDRPTQNGGGVNILSTQLLANSRFLNSAFPAGYGNALGGVFDMRLRKGNNQQREHTFQLSLIGIDLATEGPFSKNYEGSYLVNYRYSTIGLLSAMGVPLGDEEINFQDLSFNVHLPTKKAGDFTVFGMGGKSITRFEAQRDTTQWVYQKDRNDIDFYNDMGALGVTHQLRVTPNFSIRSAYALSGVESGRTADYLSRDFSKSEIEFDDISKQQHSFHSYGTVRVGKSLFQPGLVANHIYFSNRNYERNIETGQLFNQKAGSAGGMLWQPYLNAYYFLSQDLTLNYGLHYSRFAYNNASSLEPRASLKWAYQPTQNISFAYGRHSQLPPFQALTYGGNRDLGFLKADHFTIEQNTAFKEHYLLKTAVYWQELHEVPVSSNSASTYSSLNQLEFFVPDQLVSQGKGRNYGVELSAERLLAQGFYALATGSLYNSRYRSRDQVWRDTQFNGNYTFTLTTGKEFAQRQKANASRSFNINARVLWLGGLRQTPIDVAASEAAGRTVYQEQLAFTEKMPNYFRLDTRISFRKNKPGITRTISLDLQNTTNHQNLAYTYYDVRQKKLVKKYQLTLIPFLSYRLEF